MRSRRPSPPPPSVDIDGYEVLDKIGAGGFSVVYRARQRSMNREVAVKVLNTGFATEAERRTFERECHALGRLSHHPNIVTVFNEAMTADGRPCIVMELYRSTYRQRVESFGRLPVDEVLSVGVRMCGALQTAHDAGILHRDLKPHNIFLSSYDEPALGDFGISTIDDERSQSSGSGLSVAYAAPEILDDGRATTAADVYSLAATLYQLAAGTSPFASKELKTTFRRILTEPPPPLTRDDAPPGLDRALRKALAKQPSERPGSAVELAEMLREVQARAGFDRTPIPRSSVADLVAGDRSGADSGLAERTTNRRGGATPMPAPPAPSGAPRGDVAARPRPDSDLGDASDISGVTVARPRAPRQPEEAPVESGPSTRRRWIAIGAAVAAVAAVAVGVVVLGGDDGDEPGPATMATETRPPDTFFAFLAPPADVEVAVLGDGRFEVRFTAPDGADVEVEVVNGSAEGRVLTAAAAPVEFENDVASACVVARSVRADGRVSDDVGPVCSG